MNLCSNENIKIMRTAVKAKLEKLMAEDPQMPLMVKTAITDVQKRNHTSANRLVALLKYLDRNNIELLPPEYPDSATARVIGVRTTSSWDIRELVKLDESDRKRIHPHIGSLQRKQLQRVLDRDETLAGNWLEGGLGIPMD